METRVQKWGNSLGLRIPKPFAVEMGIEPNSPVEIALADGQLVVTPIDKPAPTLVQLVARVTDSNLHGEVESAPAVGLETW